jgi:hypothetical protein
MTHGARAALVLLAVSLPAGAFAQTRPTVAFSAAASSGGEGASFDTSVVLTVPNRGTTTAPVKVNFATVAGTALAGSDFVANSGTLTFATGTASGASQTVTVMVLGDALNEATETFSVVLSGAVGGAIGATSTHTRTIVDADPEPTVSIGDVSVFEGQSGTQNALFPVRLSAPSGQNITVTYATADGAASGTSDYVGVTNGVLTIPAGTTSAPLPVGILGDTTPEPDETFTVTLTAATHGTLRDAAATGTILDDDTPGSLEFSLDGFRVGEGARQATITVNRTGGRAADVTVDFDVTDGTAKAGVDFAPTSGTLTFGLEETSQTFVVPLMRNDLSEPARTALLRLRSPSTGATIGERATAILTILDDDPAGQVQFARPAFVGYEATGKVLIFLRRIRGIASDVTVHLGSTDGTAIGGQDFGPVDQDVTFGHGEVVKVISVSITPDNEVEGNETATLTLSNPRGGVRLGELDTAILTIVDAQDSVSFEKTTYSVKEAAPRAVIRVRRRGDLSHQVTVDYAATAGTATAGDDFTPTSGTLTFPPRIALRSFSVPIKNDTTVGEGPETVQLALSKPTGADIPAGRGTAVLTIEDNDPVARLEFSAEAYRVSERAPYAVIAVKRTGGRLEKVTVDYTTTNRSATAPDDYEQASGTLTFDKGVAVQIFRVPIVNDILDEGTETLGLELSNPSEGAVLGPVHTATLVILDNEPTVEFSAPRYVVSEAARVAIITVRRTGSTEDTATVHFATSDGTAKDGEDYVGVSWDLTFEPGVLSRNVPIQIVRDQIDERNETVNLTLSNPGGIELGTPATAVLTIIDNDLAGQVQFSVQTLSSLESRGPVTIDIIRTRGFSGEATVDVEILPGITTPAHDPQDFRIKTTTLTFGTGVRSQPITVDVLDDAVADGNKSVRLHLVNPTNGLIIGRQSEATLWIVDDE